MPGTVWIASSSRACLASNGPTYFVLLSLDMEDFRRSCMLQASPPVHNLPPRAYISSRRVRVPPATPPPGQPHGLSARLEAATGRLTFRRRATNPPHAG